MEWYRLHLPELYQELATSPEGLAGPEAAARLQRHGRNAVEVSRRRSPLLLLLNQFKDFMIIVLMVAALVAGFVGEGADAIVILVIVVLNACVGFVQDYRAEKAMEALQAMAAPRAVVLRDGAAATIPAEEVVPGDLVLLQGGDVVPADLRVTWASRLTVQEAALTGESVPVAKDAAEIDQEGIPLGDRRNLCYKGTQVTSGRGRGVAVATGLGTELGKIATLLGEAQQVQTPLQRRLSAFGRTLSVGILAVCLLFFCAGVLRGEGLLVMFLTAVSLAVAAIPEALPAVVTISLALGAKKLAACHALVRNLPAVETLGSVTTICTDKTGTLTENRMTVQSVYAAGKLSSMEELPESALEEGEEFLFWAALALCNEVERAGGGELKGDPTEVALFRAASEKGVDREAVVDRFRRVADLPFDEGRKLMTTVHSHGDESISFTKGAPEAVLQRSTSAGGRLDRERAGEVAAGMAADGMRVLGVAMRRYPGAPLTSPREWEEELVFLGLVGILDPPRPEAREAVRECREAGITPVMITGDHALTAESIARRLGLAEGADTVVLTGDRLAALPHEELTEALSRTRVFARVAPEQKLKIVTAFQERGEIVAMTGDGVNDAPALKRADIGVAMGITGSDVAKESADLILLDDNFATIVKAVREGRRIYDNMRKFVRYLLTTNSGEIITVALAPFLGLPMPLLPVQILWINLMTDALPALALSLEPAEGNVMGRPPRPPKESIFYHGLGMHVVLVGILIGGLVLGVQAIALRRGVGHWRTMTFTVLCFTQLFHVLAIRSERQSLFTIGILSNPALLGAVLLSGLLQLLVVYLPFLNPFFQTAPLSGAELLSCVAGSSVVFAAVEGEKFFRRRAGGGFKRGRSL